MRKYLLHRVLLIIPTLFIISVLGFYLSKQVPQDPVISVLNMRGVDDAIYATSPEAYQKVYRELGLHQPLFYVSVHPHFYPENINAISDPGTKAWVSRMLDEGIPFDRILTYLDSHPGTTISASGKEKIPDALSDDKVRFYYPVIRWHGTRNQYHSWITSFFEGTFGYSIADGKPVLQKSLKALSWTLAITLTDLVISLLLGIWLGIWLARHAGTKKESIVSQVLYGLYAMPLFWLATLLIVFFTTDQYGALTNIFPSIGIDVYPGKSTGQQILYNMDKLLLPILCLTLHSLAYISRFVRRSIRTEMDKAYITTAYSKGLSTDRVLYRHALPNALIPVITILGSVIPGAFTGSLVLEVLFNIPGFGRLLYTSIAIADWNVAYCILLIVAFVTIISYLLADVLYAFVNPKIRFTS